MISWQKSIISNLKSHLNFWNSKLPSNQCSDKSVPLKKSTPSFFSTCLSWPQELFNSSFHCLLFLTNNPFSVWLKHADSIYLFFLCRFLWPLWHWRNGLCIGNRKSLIVNKHENVKLITILLFKLDSFMQF